MSEPRGYYDFSGRELASAYLEQRLVTAHREANPLSRAVGICRYVINTGSRKRRGCILCGAEGPGWASAWPRTKASHDWEAAHVASHLEEVR